MILVDNVGGWFGDHLARQDPANHKNRTVWFGVGKNWVVRARTRSLSLNFAVSPLEKNTPSKSNNLNLYGLWVSDCGSIYEYKWHTQYSSSLTPTSPSPASTPSFCNAVRSFAVERGVGCRLCDAVFPLHGGMLHVVDVCEVPVSRRHSHTVAQSLACLPPPNCTPATVTRVSPATKLHSCTPQQPSVGAVRAFSTPADVAQRLFSPDVHQCCACCPSDLHAMYILMRALYL